MPGDLTQKRRAARLSRHLLHDLASQRLHLLIGQTEEEKEQEFWEWTKRPDIQEKLNLVRKKYKSFQDQLRAMVPELAPHLPPPEPDEDSAPAALI